MKTMYLAVGFVTFLALFSLFSIIKFATVVNDKENTKSASASGTIDRTLMRISNLRENMHDNHSYIASLRYPYITAILARNGTNGTEGWVFSCFGSVILMKWIVTAAHCKIPGHSHRVLLFYDYIRNSSRTYPVLQWIVHAGFNASSVMPWHDIALARVSRNLEPTDDDFVFTRTQQVHASIWKTLMTMDRRVYLTNDLSIYDVDTTDPSLCYELYGFTLDNTLICVDMASYPDDCFITEFGPIYTSTERVLGVLRKNSRDCDIKAAIFTNVSSYHNWILEETKVYDDKNKLKITLKQNN